MREYPKKKLAQLVLQALVENKIKDVVISPGSRNAPLTIGFVNHPLVRTHSLVDERSAAFFALGLSQQSQNPVSLLCTSGSALLNYYPAVAEAYYSKIPLVVISADRPPHLIDIGDGQTIRQGKALSEHILFESSLDESFPLEKNAETISRALRIAKEQSGPVHLNVPFDEPLYETVPDLYDFSGLELESKHVLHDSLLKETPIPLQKLEGFAEIWNRSSKKMVILGVNYPDPLIRTQMSHLVKDPSVLVLTETTSNVWNEKFVANIDQLIFSLSEEEFEKLRPEVLLTFGGMVVSKRIKQFLRRHQPDHHWHIDAIRPMDTYHCLTRHFSISPQLFFSQFFFLTRTLNSTYQSDWLKRYASKKELHGRYLERVPYSDFMAFYTVFRSLPQGIRLQLSNSSVIRYSQLYDFKDRVEVYCNRGTSGIDGSTSTAIGAASAFEGQTVLVTGDLSFFYDSNAFWNKNIPKSFRVIVVNNRGGGIFRILPGPQDSGALDYFETPHELESHHLCDMHGVSYRSASSLEGLESCLVDFFESGDGPRLLEIFTPAGINDKVLKEYFNFLHKG